MFRNTTQFSYNINKNLEYSETTIFVQVAYYFIHHSTVFTVYNDLQMRSLIPDEINLLPQWSDPKYLNFSLVPPPSIRSSELISTSITVAVHSNNLYVNAVVQLVWEDVSLDSGELTHYDVWVGSRTLGDFEQPEENDMTGNILSIPVCNNVKTLVFKGISMISIIIVSFY